MAGTTFQELLEGVANYYGSGSDQWAQIAQYGVTTQTLPIIQQVPGVTVTVSNSGQYLGYDYNNPFTGASNPASAIDSNVQTGAYGTGAFNAQLPGTATTNPSTGTTSMQSGAVSNTSGSIVSTIADRVSLAVTGVALGTKLGQLIDSGIYALNPDWWDEHYPTLNPQTWSNMATTQGGKDFIRSLFGIENNSATMYLDERLLAYTYMMLLQAGVYSSGGRTIVIDNPDYETYSIINTPVYQNPVFNGAYYRYESTDSIHTITITSGTVDVCFCTVNNNNITWHILSKTPFTGTSTLNAPPSSPTSITPTHTTINNKDIYYYTPTSFNTNFRNSSIPIYTQVSSSGNNTSAIISPDAPEILYYILLYQSTIIDSPTVPGISENPQAGTQIDPTTVINPTTGLPVTPNDNLQDVLDALRLAYPNLFSGSIYQNVPQPDGTTQRITYIPVPYPDTSTPEQPITDTTPGIDPQTTPQVDPNTRPEQLIQQLTDTLTTDPTPPDTGDGDTPEPIIPIGAANALYAIYNPTQGELNSFGAWLWSSNFVDQLLKLFNDPMQAIIGLHKVFAQPSISGTSTIKVGYLDSGVSSNVVGNQYTTIDCGSVNVSEYFGNVFDYDPFTQIYIYLPFVGIEKLDTGDVMRGRVGVKYHVDVLTGACLAEISVTRDGAGGILYTFAGNCAVQYPISSGSYMGIVASLASIAGGVVGTVASGGALAPVAMGAVSGIMNAHTRVNHSGAFSGNAGAMGVKKPYLIITRPQTCLADNFPAFNGYPANKTTTLSTCSGFVKCETCHVENIPATDAELSEIEMLLKGGIII